MKPTKRIESLDEFLDKNPDISSKTRKEILNQKYKQSLSEAKGSDNDSKNIEKLNIKTGYYSLKTKISKNPWIDKKPATKAIAWLFQTVFKNPAEFRYNKKLMYMGGLFQFEYKNPKYKGTNVLPWFDKYPLVLSLGPVVTNLGIRNIGFNLHLLPPKIRVVVLCSIFELYKRLYRYQIFLKVEKPIMIHYSEIIKKLDKYGIKFCVRMYIPERMNQIVRFPMKEWHKAIFIPSRGYDSIKANALIKEWKKFCRNKHFPGVENVNWKSLI